MELRLPMEEGWGYRSPSQRTRRITEAWAQRNVFCAACSSNELRRAKNNTAAYDFSCPGCGAVYQLKASSHALGGKVLDAGYEAMMEAIRKDRLPHFLLLRYAPSIVLDFTLLPGFALSGSAIERRTPLSSSARRAGWVGCNILVSQIPSDARIPIVQCGQLVPMRSVRERFANIATLSKVRPTSRGWALDVLTGLRNLGTPIFTLEEAYSLENELARLHPQNKNIRPKIRQQLQVLRDLSYIRFRKRGLYEFRSHLDRGATT